MEAAAVYPGSMGEIIQGKLHNRDVLLSCPVNLFTKVRIFESKSPSNAIKYQKCFSFLHNMARAWNMEAYAANIDIDISSEIPRGKGFASSTADLCALYHSMLKLFNKKYNEEELIRECIRIEPTDSIVFKKATIFDYKDGKFYKEIGEYLEFHMIVFEGRNVVDTIEFNKKSLPAQKDIQDICKVIESGIKKKDIKALAYAATESILRNQQRLKYDLLSEIVRIKNLTGGLGIIGAHSGDALGIIFDDEEKLNRALKSKFSFDKYKIRKLSTLKWYEHEGFNKEIHNT